MIDHDEWWIMMNYHAARIMGFLYVSDIFDGNI